MYHLKAGLTPHTLHVDEAESTSGPNASEDASEEEDALPHAHASLHDLSPGTCDVDNVHVCVRTGEVPLPVDMMLAIGQFLDLDDLPRFFSMNRAFNLRYRTDQIVYANSLYKIGSATRFSEIADALTAITRYKPHQQPYLLRAMAESRRMKTERPMYGAIPEWKEGIDTQFDWHAAQAAGHERELALQRLIIARGFAITESPFSHDGEPLEIVIGDRLNTLAPEYWPPIFEAFLPDGDVGKLLWHCKFKARFKGNIRATSTEFAIMLALEFLRPPHDYVDVSALLHTRFGVSETCLRQELDPVIAVAIANAGKQMSSDLRIGWLMRATQHWRPDDHHFVSLVTDAFVKSFDAAVFRKRSFSSLLKEDFAMLPWLENSARERIIFLESATIAALRNTEQNAEEQIDAFLKLIDLIDEIPTNNNDISAINYVIGVPFYHIGMPLVAQPALFHRLVSIAHLNWHTRSVADAFIRAAIDCRDALISGNAWNSPLVSRVSAALILASIHLRKHDAGAADAVTSNASALAFSYVAIEDWGDILEALIDECTLNRPLAIEKWDPIDEQIASFICHPDSCAHYLPALSHRIGNVVASVWHALPDEAEDGRSRFDVFRLRIGLPQDMRQAALKSIATSLVLDIDAGSFFLEDVALASGFDDPDAIGALENAVFEWMIRSTLRADSDVDAITNQYTKHSLYLRSLIAQAVNALAIAADLENPVPTTIAIS